MTSIASTPRRPLDFYPTPRPVVSVLCQWLESRPDAPGATDRFFDSSAGVGNIIEAMRSGRWGDSHWSAYEIDLGHGQALELVADNVSICDALSTPWPADTHLIQNPPFWSLDEFWDLAENHARVNGVWCATLTPVAWWNAEKRASYRRPDFMLALGWRPVFHAQTGPAHKGSQDFCWSVLAPEPQANH